MTSTRSRVGRMWSARAALLEGVYVGVRAGIIMSQKAKWTEATYLKAPTEELKCTMNERRLKRRLNAPGGACGA
ncbi:hypothetical protein C8F01DRAFT_1139085 [Mycena amicta]|nr:hypothetical protein C8F01DRAFT_1139085 [Mycena amicta]